MQQIADDHMKGDDWLNKAMQWTISKHTDAFKQQALRVTEQWQAQTIIPEHGDVMQGAQAQTMLRERFKSALPK